MDWQREHSAEAIRQDVSQCPGGTDTGRPDAEPELQRLDHAVNHLRRTRPELSSAYSVVGWQAATLVVLTVALVIGAAVMPSVTHTVVFATMALSFFCIVAIRILAIATLLSVRAPAPESPNEKSGLDEVFPRYAILVPLYKEAEVVPALIEALSALDYPTDCLEISLIVEREDRTTRMALEAQVLPTHMRIVEVPEGQPRTKPRALNYALASARGDYVVVYDAEDMPEPDQLRRALKAFRSAGPELGCVQACLNTYNPEETFFTRQFTIEYTALFDAIVPTLARLDLPVPLGGTSNHFPRRILETSGGWDPFNVTEDADLGIRLARQGARVAGLASTTWEEAPETFRIWLGQRTRWLKGWMQTYIVHMREPTRLLRDLGLKRFAGLQVLMGGMILSCLVHPWFYVVLGASLLSGRSDLLVPSDEWHVLYWAGLFNLFAGYVSAIALGAIAVARRGRPELAISVLAVPIYWLLISWAAYRALWELVSAPHHWEKTQHHARNVVANSNPPLVT
ncbi:glycosyltransferase [Filomicrobium sp.]|uniref:glycosyltransferase n=1 Tax=Filomicrobium sp. TaxID=2024831 RepID=UPI002587DCF1|nr:glycosyltransferase [Filomicrobium sp.]MCV0367836.1 glycosyltransferase [Filomicrobium sp.]